MTGRTPTHVVFLHGYTSPGEPSRQALSRAFNSAGITAELHTPIAPSGSTRIDPFNPSGASSWFRYATDLSNVVPQGIDYANLQDVHEVMYSPWTVDGSEQSSLWDLMTSLAGTENGKQVALVGESQGGVMAALLGIEWNRQFPTNQLGWLALVRTAPDPHTWQPRPMNNDATFDFDLHWEQTPPRYETRFCVVLGADDPTYRTYTSIGAIGPLLINNTVVNTDIRIHHSNDGNVDLRILPRVTHDSHEDEVFAAVAQSIVVMGTL